MSSRLMSLGDQTLELTNLGRAPRIVHDAKNNQVTIMPGETKRVDMPGPISFKMGKASDLGDSLRVGEVTRNELRNAKASSIQERRTMPPSREPLSTRAKLDQPGEEK